jgi:hypothetical protein
MEYLLSHLDLVQRGVELLLVMWAVLKRADKALLLHLRTSLEPRLQRMDEKLDDIQRLVKIERKRRNRQHKRILRLEKDTEH